jgi:hypothetical protein
LLEVPFGGSSKPTGFRIAEYNDTSAWYLPDSGYNVSFGESKELLDGLCIEVIWLDERTRVQEWFVPWSQYGKGGVARGRRGGSVELALILGYNDADGDLQPEEFPDRLRWKNLCDPWCGQLIDTYGDLFVPFLAPDTSATLRPGLAHGPAGGKSVITEYFTLKGQRLSPRSRGATRVPCVLAQRDVLRGGEARITRLVCP